MPAKSLRVLVPTESTFSFCFRKGILVRVSMNQIPMLRSACQNDSMLHSPSKRIHQDGDETQQQWKLLELVIAKLFVLEELPMDVVLHQMMSSSCRLGPSTNLHDERGHLLPISVPAHGIELLAPTWIALESAEI